MPARDAFGPVDINYPLASFATCSCLRGPLGVDEAMESNQRYYYRRAVEERMAAQRAVTEQARAWHAKLAEDFAHRATITDATLTASA